MRRLKRDRNAGDYKGSAGAITPEHVAEDLPVAAAILAAAERITPQMPVFLPGSASGRR